MTHLCGAPIVLNMLVHAPSEVKQRFEHVVEVATGGAAPPSAVIEAMEQMGFHVTHLYGLTESYGPATLCAGRTPGATWPSTSAPGRWRGRGYRCRRCARSRWAIRKRTSRCRADGVAIGEVMLRGNTLMKGYLKNETATSAALREGWFHTGDLAVWHPDGYIEIKDRAKDIIISGGENISSLEVEECLYRHPQVMEAAVVARPDPKWGETPCAFVTLRPMRSACTPRSSSPGVATGSRTSRCRAPSSSARCRRPPPARFRSLCCASAPRRSATPRAELG